MGIRKYFTDKRKKVSNFLNSPLSFKGLVYGTIAFTGLSIGTMSYYFNHRANEKIKEAKEASYKLKGAFTKLEEEFERGIKRSLESLHELKEEINGIIPKSLESLSDSK